MSEIIISAAYAMELLKKHYFKGLKELLTTAPEVVRCGKCVYARPLDKYEKKIYLAECVGCIKHSTSYSSVVMAEDDFCSYGERR